MTIIDTLKAELATLEEGTIQFIVLRNEIKRLEKQK